MLCITTILINLSVIVKLNRIAMRISQKFCNFHKTITNAIYNESNNRNNMPIYDII